jgi:uncharacterized protein
MLYICIKQNVMILKSDIRKIWELQNEMLSQAEPGIPREISAGFNIPAQYALIVTGIRRCGKSTLLHQLLKNQYKEAFYMNFDDNRLFGFDHSDLLRLDDVIREEGSRLLFFDELQEIPGWEQYVRQKLDENCRVVITGSNATLMSRELGTKLTGRHLDLELFPFSFREFLQSMKMEAGESAVISYMKMGGFPGYLNSGNEQILSDLFDDILIRDIVIRYNIRDVKALQRLALWLISNCANKVTGSKLKHTVGIASTSTILEYFSHLESSYLFSFVPCFSYSVRSQMVSPKKVYSADTGLTEINSASFTDDSGHKLENLVYNHLRAKHKSIFYFSNRNECDFIVTSKGKNPLVIQVCYELDRDNLDRELDGLFQALSFFNQKSGLLVTLNQSDSFTKADMTARVIPVWEFLQNPASLQFG